MRLLKLTLIGFIASLVLAACMQLIYQWTGNEAYQLLYNADYIPILQRLDHLPYFGFTFHVIFCLISVIGVFYLLTIWQRQYEPLPYLLIYTGGSALLYFLSFFTETPPAAHDLYAWFYWTLSHFVYSLTVVILIHFWIKKR